MSGKENFDNIRQEAHNIVDWHYQNGTLDLDQAGIDIAIVRRFLSIEGQEVFVRAFTDALAKSTAGARNIEPTAGGYVQVERAVR